MYLLPHTLATGPSINWDSLFSYSTHAKISIQDYRLGALHLSFSGCIFLYVVLYQIVLCQNYAIESGVLGTVRMNLIAPDLKYRGPQDQQFCLGATKYNGANTSSQNAGMYSFFNDTYTFNGLTSPQGHCTYLDPVFAEPYGSQPNAIMMPTRVTTDTQQVYPLLGCESFEKPDCAWITTSTLLEYVPDPEFYLISIDHSIASLHGSLTRSARQMTGTLVDNFGEQT